MKNKPILYILPFALALAAGCNRPAPARHIAISMKKYTISPAVIRLQQGETVRFVVTSIDVQHGFTVPELGISEPVNPGKPATFSYTATKQGSFRIECGIICGSGHDDMRARLVVE